MLEALWSDGLLDEARTKGDKLADGYAELILNPPDPKEVAELLETFESDQASILDSLRAARKAGGSDVETVLEKGLSSSRPVLMEFVCAPEENVFPMVPAGAPSRKMIHSTEG